QGKLRAQRAALPHVDERPSQVRHVSRRRLRSNMTVSSRRGCRSPQGGISLIELLISMVILGIITTMLITGWISLQRATATVTRTDNARATGRDAMARISSELRASQPTVLPTPSGTGMPDAETPIAAASPNSVTFYSAFNSAVANQDGSGVDALRP